MGQKSFRAYALCGAMIAVISGSAQSQTVTEAEALQGQRKGPVSVNNASGNLVPVARPPVERARDLYRRGRLDEAEHELESVIRDEPASVLSYVALTQVYLRHHKVEAAYKLAAKAIEMEPSLDAAHTALGEVYFRQGKLHEAEKEFMQLVKAGTREARAYLGLGTLYWSAAFYKHAKAMLDRAYALDPGDPDVRRAWVDSLMPNERTKALQSYLSAGIEGSDRDRFERQLTILRSTTGLTGSSCRLATDPAATDTPLIPLTHDSLAITAFALPVALNDTQGKFKLDTGASGLLVSKRLADKSAIKRITDVPIRGVGDTSETKGYIGKAGSIKVAGLEFKDCYVTVIDKSSVLGEDGLIGADVFSSFLIDIDFPGARFKLSKLPDRPGEPVQTASLESGAGPSSGYFDKYTAPEMKSFTPFFRFAHLLLIQTLLNDSVKKLFLLDTGSYSNSVSLATASELITVSRDGDSKLKGFNGDVKGAFRAGRIMIQFGGFKQLNENMMAIDTTRISDSVGTNVSGILGLSLLHLLDIKIDYRDGIIDFQYKPNPSPPEAAGELSKSQ
ncbi:MAG TPA: aspartyl protease family protein [Blastocatellia bacterium]